MTNCNIKVIWKCFIIAISAYFIHTIVAIPNHKTWLRLCVWTDAISFITEKKLAVSEFVAQGNNSPNVTLVTMEFVICTWTLVYICILMYMHTCLIHFIDKSFHRHDISTKFDASPTYHFIDKSTSSTMETCVNGTALTLPTLW